MNLSAPNSGASPPPAPSLAFHILGRGLRGSRRGGGGLVSKLGCNLRKSPGSVGSGETLLGWKAPHLAEKGGVLESSGPGHRGRQPHLPAAPLP